MSAVVRLVSPAVNHGRPPEWQAEILRWVAAGKRTEEIAEIMGTTAGAVDNKIARLMTALGANTRAGLVAVALRKGLIT